MGRREGWDRSRGERVSGGGRGEKVQGWGEESSRGESRSRDRRAEARVTAGGKKSLQGGGKSQRIWSEPKDFGSGGAQSIA